MSPSVDVRVLLELNSRLPSSLPGLTFVNFIGNNPFFRGFPVFFPIAALWFAGDSKIRRSRMLTGLIGTCVATVISVWMQHHVLIHIRPFLDPKLHLQGIVPQSTLGWDRLGSFPSDTASLFFALATVLFLEHRAAGTVAFVWALFTAGFTRIALGWHYPSDILGGLVLGVACVVLLTRIRPVRSLFERLLLRWESRMYLVHAVMFLFLADAYTLFVGLQDFYHGIGQVGAYLVRRLL